MFDPEALKRLAAEKAAWEAKVDERLHHAVQRFAEFLDEQQPEQEIDSPYLPFGSVA